MKKTFLSGVLSLLLLMIFTTVANAAVTITSQGGWFESAYVEFTPDGSSYYNVYYSTNQSSWTKIDDQLVRKYSSSKGRADVLGITAGTYYIKVASVNSNGTETSNTVSGALTVKAHNRDGFAHLNWSKGVGAYKNDGTLKSGANVLYITKSNAKTVTMTVPSAATKTAVYTGLQTIIDAWTKAYSKGWSTTPLDIRVLGTLSYDDMDSFSSSAEGIQIKGDSYSDCPITFEGIGNDAVIHGFGFLIRNTTDLEMRNFAIMNCLDDCISLDTHNSHVWIHNIDFFYGNAGSAADQVKGDGTVDLKGDSQYITISYNHFWDTGKSSLCGMKSESGPNYISYHHNWFDHSDSRHPRIRTMTVHMFNNYFDGNSKYGVGTTMGSSCFVDRNYFRNCKNPMMSSLQGTDAAAAKGTFSGETGGMIKAYGNKIVGASSLYVQEGYPTGASEAGAVTNTASQSFDCYLVSNPSTQVPSSYVTVSGGTKYDNFDTNSSLMYSYTADAADDVPTIVKGAYGAGRMQHGTYQYTFTDTDDTDYGVISALKSVVSGYKTTSYYVGVTNSMYFKDGVITDSAVETGGGEEEPETPTTSTDATLKSLSVAGYSLSFSSSTTSYNVTLAYDAESAPTVSAVANNSNATVKITQATSTTGTATVTVTAQDGTTKMIYTVQFSVGSEPAPSGSTISSAMTLNMGDGTNAYKSYLTGTYNTSTSGIATYGGVTNSTLSIKMESSTSISFTTTKAFTMTFVAGSTETASFKLDGTTVKASSGNIVSVDVAAGTHTLTKSGAIKMYFLDFAEVESEPEPEPVLSSDATLSALSVAGYTLSPAFSSSTLTYSVELAAGTTTVPAITATCNDAGAKYSVDTESCHPAGQAIIDVEAEDGTSGKYYINFTVAATQYSVAVVANAGGTASVIPSGSVAEGTQVTFTATPNSGYVFSKWSDNSTENPHTVTVTGDLTLTASFAAQGTSGDILYSYSVTAGQAAVTDATATGGTFTSTKKAESSAAIKIDFDKQEAKYVKLSLTNALQTGDQIALTMYQSGTSSPNNNYGIGIATSATGDNLATVTIPTSSGKNSTTYTLSTPSTLNGVSTLYLSRLNGNSVYFEAVNISRTGSTPVVSSDATLSDLAVNGTTVSGFSASTTSYNVVLPLGTTTVPTVTAAKNDSGASVSITQASSISGTAAVVVTAEDGTTQKTYTIQFSVSTKLNLTDAANYVAGTYAAGDVTYTRSTTSGKYGSFCLPFDFNTSEAEGIAKIYVPVNIAVYNTTTNKLRLFLALQNGTIAAGTPFIALFNGATSVANSAEVTLSSTMSNPSPTVLDVFNTTGSDGALLENEALTVTWNGTYVSAARVEGMKSFNSNGDFGDHSAATLGAFRAYLVLTSSTNNNSIEVEWLVDDEATAVESLKSQVAVGGVDVYSVEGVQLKKNVSADEALNGLAPGIYVINGKKVVK